MADINLYPFVLSDSVEVDETIEPFKEIAWDFSKDKPMVDEKTKEYVIVEGIEALKVWIYKTVKIARYRYPIYSTDYGTEIEELIGQKYTKGYTESEATRYIKEALSINNYIKNINIVSASFENDILTAHINVDTIYNEEVDMIV